MCGIVGACLFGNQEKNERILRVKILKHLFMNALAESETRGRDATGIALFTKNSWQVIKQPVKASEFVLEKEQEEDARLSNFLKGWDDSAEDFISVLGHVRSGTQGSEYDPENNHPIIIGEGTDRQIIGIHNGVIGNDDTLFKKYEDLKRIGKVDSEIIFQLLYKFSENEITKEALVQMEKDISGSFVTLSVSTGDPYMLVGANSTGRPCEVFFIPEIQAAFIISETKFFDEAMKEYEKARIRGEFDRKLTRTIYNKTMTSRYYAIDTRKDIDKADDIFDYIETYPYTTTTSSYNYTTGSYNGSTCGYNGNAGKGYSGGETIYDGWDDDDKGENEKNFNPPPAPQVKPSDTIPPKPADPPKEKDEKLETMAEIEENDDAADHFTELHSFNDLLCMGGKAFKEVLDGEGDYAGKDWILKLNSKEKELFVEKDLIEIRRVLNEDSKTENLSNCMIKGVYERAFSEGYAVGYKECYEEVLTEYDDGDEEDYLTRLRQTEAAYLKATKELEKQLKQKEYLVKGLFALMNKEAGDVPTYAETKAVIKEAMSKTAVKSMLAILRNCASKKTEETTK